MAADWVCLPALALAAGCSLDAWRSRWVWTLGRWGPALAPAFLLILWFLGLSLGQAAGSLAAMSALAAAPLAALAAYGRRLGRRRRFPYRWTPFDWAAFAAVAALLFAYVGHDCVNHYAVVGAYLRGNIPPSAMNDPLRRMPYHVLFDAGSAVVARAGALGPQGAANVMGTVCLAACLFCLQAVSRMLFIRPLSCQAARLFFLCGFGPVYARLWLGPREFDFLRFFHGQTTQSFPEILLRRPMALNFVLFLFVLAACLPAFSSSERPAVGPRRAPHPAWLLPCAYLLPQASEELTALATLLVLATAAFGRAPAAGAAAWLLAVAAGAPSSALLRGMSGGRGQDVLLPTLGFLWPPRLPHQDAWQKGAPLLSRLAAWSLLAEWGPFFFGALALSLRDARRRALSLCFAAGLLVACLTDMGRWPQFDLDRFLFYGTCAGFMLSAAWIERLEAARESGRLGVLPWRALAGALALMTVLGPLGYIASHVGRGLQGRPVERLLSIATTRDLRRALAAVGPRETVLADAAHAQWLALAGFVVDAPMTSRDIGLVTWDDVASYLKKDGSLSPSWLLLAEGHPLLCGLTPAAAYGGCVLARAARRLTAAEAAGVLDAARYPVDRERWGACGQALQAPAFLKPLASQKPDKPRISP